MMSEMLQAKRFLGIKFGYGEPLQDGLFAIPTSTSKGDAFMRMEIKEGKPAGDKNFSLYWDEELTVDWYNNPKPEETLKESEFSQLFRKIDAVR